MENENVEKKRKKGRRPVSPYERRVQILVNTHAYMIRYLGGKEKVSIMLEKYIEKKYNRKKIRKNELRSERNNN